MPDETIILHYKDLLATHGDSAQAVQYADTATQHARYAVLAGIAPDPAALGSVLDVGCGLAHLHAWLRAAGFEGRYVGVDVVPEFVERANETLAGDPLAEVRLLAAEETELPECEHALLSGVFNNRMADNAGFMRDVLRRMFRAARTGIAFNAMSHYVDYRDEELFYTDPLEVLRFCKEDLGGHPVLRHDYMLREGGYPFEYAVHLYQAPRVVG